MTFGTDQQAYLINFLNQAGPILPELFGRHIVRDNGGDAIIRTRPFPHPPGFVRIVTAVPDSLLIPAGNLRHNIPNTKPEYFLTKIC